MWSLSVVGEEGSGSAPSPMHDGGFIGVLDPMGERDHGGVGGYASAGRDQGKLDVGAAGATVEDGGLVASGGVGVGGPGEGIVRA